MRLLLIFIIGIFSISGYSQSKNGIARVFLNNTAKSYAADGSSKFTNILIEALESETGSDQSLNIGELFRFFQENELRADTVTYGKNDPGSEFIFANRNDKSRNYALIIYVEEYDTWEKVEGIENDAVKIESLLKNNFGYNTELVANPTRIDLLMTIRKYTIMKYKPNDHLFIYFAGHGYYDNLYKWNYLVLKDSQKEEEVKQSYMPVSQLLMFADNISADKVLVFIDAGTK
jgi:hypothetical protein